jgi:hypothetical protein
VSLLGVEVDDSGSGQRADLARGSLACAVASMPHLSQGRDRRNSLSAPSTGTPRASCPRVDGDVETDVRRSARSRERSLQDSESLYEPRCVKRRPATCSEMPQLRGAGEGGCTPGSEGVVSKALHLFPITPHPPPASRWGIWGSQVSIHPLPECIPALPLQQWPPGDGGARRAAAVRIPGSCGPPPQLSVLAHSEKRGGGDD